jgi:hypothetical protein
MAANRRAKFDVAGGTVAFGSVGAAYSTLVGPTSRCVGMLFLNDLDAATVISLDGGTTDFVTLPAGINYMLNFAALGVEYAGTVKVKRLSGAPTTGNISCGIVREE